MGSRTPLIRWTVRGGAVGSAVALAAGLAWAGLQAAGAATAGGVTAGGVTAGSVIVGAGSASPRLAGSGPADPYSPAYRHPYRRGALPTTSRLREMSQRASRAARVLAVPAATASENVGYGGGINGVGVTTGHEKVYLVFWGSQWATQGSNASGDLTLSGDPSGVAPYLQQLFKGLGTGGETWSGVMTQYCDGVRRGALACPANSWHVGYPAGGALAGVWPDEGAAAPARATGHQLGAEAVAAARHFHNTSAAANRDAQYVIVSPPGTHPDGFNTPEGDFCGWHDDTADRTLPGGPVSSAMDIAFTNLPYVPDAGTSCGENFVNAGPAGVLDGVSIVAGHEYAETITDQLPMAGWSNSSTGEEVADQCAWIPPGTTGGAKNLKLTTGTFAMQSTWANDSRGGQGGCSFSHQTITNNWIVNGGFEWGTLGGWTASGPVTKIVRSGAYAGRYAARAGAPIPTHGSSRLAHSFIARGTNLSFWYDVTCPDTVARSWVAATLTDTARRTTRTVLARTCLAHSGWRQVTATVTAGHSYTLTLTSHDDGDSGDGTFTLFDAVSNR